MRGLPAASLRCSQWAQYSWLLSESPLGGIKWFPSCHIGRSQLSGPCGAHVQCLFTSHAVGRVFGYSLGALTGVWMAGPISGVPAAIPPCPGAPLAHCPRALGQSRAQFWSARCLLAHMQSGHLCHSGQVSQGWGCYRVIKGPVGLLVRNAILVLIYWWNPSITKHVNYISVKFSFCFQFDLLKNSTWALTSGFMSLVEIQVQK